MPMRVVGTDALHAFCLNHPDCRTWVRSWLAETRVTDWPNPQAIKSRYANASFLAGNTVIFNVRGNEYRLEVQIAYSAGIVRVVWIGTHADYSRRRR